MHWARWRRGCARSAFAPVLTSTVLTGTVLTGAVLALAACSSNGGSGPNNLLQGDYQDVIAKALPSVVEINTPKSSGSGIVFDAKGDIVTNAHVVGTATKFEVVVSAATMPLPAKLVGIFAPDDLAVIKVTRGARYLAPAQWADSTSVQIGDIVLAMGAPFGLIDSVTQGIVSATGRIVTGPTIPGQPRTVIIDAIQISAAINPGNSGGALVLLTGQVVGIPTLSAVDPDIGAPADGIGFAIPGNTVRDIASQLIKSGRVTRSDRASLQMTGQIHTNATGIADGVTVLSEQPEGAAAKAGIVAGEMIVGVQRKPTLTLTELETVLAELRPGQKVTVQVRHAGIPKQLTVTLGMMAG